jgi:hypothetical protein
VNNPKATVRKTVVQAFVHEAQEQILRKLTELALAGLHGVLAKRPGSITASQIPKFRRPTSPDEKMTMTQRIIKLLLVLNCFIASPLLAQVKVTITPSNAPIPTRLAAKRFTFHLTISGQEETTVWAVFRTNSSLVLKCFCRM